MKVWPCNFIIYNRRPFTDDHPYSKQDQNKTCVSSRITPTQLKKKLSSHYQVKSMTFDTYKWYMETNERSEESLEILVW